MTPLLIVGVISWLTVFKISASTDIFDCSFESIYPRQYIAYFLNDEIVVDGKLDESAWLEVPFTDNFVDISTTTSPMLSTKAKVRWNNDFLFVAALIEEPFIWANITETCHCLNSSQDQVIFHDNDFEIFVDIDGSNHYYKEFEINAANATWDLCLNKPYNDNGYENSTRVYGSEGFDLEPPLYSATFINGRINDPGASNLGWSVEVALPIAGLAVNKTFELPLKSGTFWRINFSRVEWHVDVVNGSYLKNPSCQSCPQPGSPNEDNWVWSPQGQIAMHLPEKWGMLQLSRELPGQTKLSRNPEWTVRSIAMSLYYAEHTFNQNFGKFTDDLKLLEPFAEPEGALSGICSGLPSIVLNSDATEFVARVEDSDRAMVAVIRNDRLLKIEYQE